MKKIIIVSFMSLLAVSMVSSFFAGIKYKESKNKNPRGFGNFTDKQQFQKQDNRNRANGGFVIGEILSKDEKSITVKTRDGGSKIVFYSDTTKILEMTTSSLSSLETGKSVSISGTQNQDGSIISQIIQIQNRSQQPQQPSLENKQ